MNSTADEPYFAPFVLIVEDDPLWRRIIHHTLSKHNVLLVEATTLAEAEEALSQSEFELVLTDYELPDGCGLDLLDHFDRSRMGRVVLATGHIDPQDLFDERCALVDRFLTKPFLSSDLIACLDGLVEPLERTAVGAEGR